MPPQSGGERAGGIGKHIEGIGGRVPYQPWSDPFEEHGPKRQMEDKLADPGWSVIRAQAQLAMQPEHRRQSAGDQPAVIKMRMKEPGVDVGLYQPPIG